MSELLHQFCESYAHHQVEKIQQQIMGLQESLQSETKSSAGDKHETGRAMVQLEREKLGIQLAEAEYTLRIIQKIPYPPKQQLHVHVGNFVRTTSGSYYIAISAGKTTYESETVFCVSAATPIARALIGAIVGQSVVFNSKELQVLEIS